MKKLSYVLLLFVLGSTINTSIFAQKSKYAIKVEPEAPLLNVGEKLQLRATVVDNDGNIIEGEKVFFYSRNRKMVGVSETGELTAYKGGTANIIIVRPDPDGRYTRMDLEVKVSFPAVDEVQVVNAPKTMFSGTSIALSSKIIDVLDGIRDDLEVRYSSQNNEIFSVDMFGNLVAKKPGTGVLVAEVEGVKTSYDIEVQENPVKSLEISSPMNEARRGDVIPFSVKAMGADGAELTDVPILYAFQGKSDNPSYTAGGMIEQDGRFVGYEAGRYSITASCGNVSATSYVQITERDIQKKIDFIGQGSVGNVHTSDLWVWEGADGRDYAVTGTWGGDGEAYFWDVTNPESIVGIDTFKVDARTVNDVKISEEGRICVISREGASNRKNGMVILDVTDPRNVKQHAVFDEGLTGGVHNLFIYKDHVYALSNGERYDIINIEDPTKPKKVGTFELDTPGHAIHDVWIEDGLAYSSNWSDGVQIVDIGNGIKGGSPSNPQKVASYAYPSGWNHAAFPFKSPSTGKNYVVAGDEAFPYGLHVEGKPTFAAGYLHFVDFSDMDNPKEVAHYEVPGAGSHNYWIDGDILYVANYNAGLRVVDISGDLMGDIFKQGREIGWFKPTDPKGKIANAPMTWGPQPHKGHIFFSDWNSGLWAVKVRDDEERAK